MGASPGRGAKKGGGVRGRGLGVEKLEFFETTTQKFRVAFFPPVSPISLRGLRYNMPVSDHLSITPLQEESRRIISEERPTGFGMEAVRLLSKPLPFSAQRRNLLSLFLFFATVAWFWQPLVSLFSLTQQN